MPSIDMFSLSRFTITAASRMLSYYKVPRIIEFISQMPRSAIGEIVNAEALEGLTRMYGVTCRVTKNA